MSKKYYIIAGEASGDLHGGNLINAIKKISPDSQVRCWGGDKMQQAGGFLVKHYKELAFMGFIEVVKNLQTILNNLDFCKIDILTFKPDVLVLIDYPGFNLRIAKWAKRQGIKVVYYIAPQVWAWKEGRVKMMKQCIDKMLVILPFEKDYFKNKWNWNVEYVGHPLIEEIEKKIKSGAEPLSTTNNKFLQKPIIALLPGSRKQEIEKKLPVMLKASRSFPDFQFVIAQAPSLDITFYKNFTTLYPEVALVKNQTYDLLIQSNAALVTSGTATLETALLGVPEVVCYKGSDISYRIAKMVIGNRIKFISLVNLIMDKEIVTELIQAEMNEKNIIKELDQLLHNSEKIESIKKDYNELKNKLTTGENASVKAAEIITEFAEK